MLIQQPKHLLAYFGVQPDSYDQIKEAVLDQFRLSWLTNNFE